MRFLFLDDAEERWDSFKKRTIGIHTDWVKTATECIEKLDQDQYTDVFLDHDLEEEHYGGGYGSFSGTGTGFDVVRWIIQDLSNNLEKFKEVNFYVHSLNPDGAKRMVEALRSSGLRVLQAPFIWANIRVSGNPPIKEDIVIS